VPIATAGKIVKVSLPEIMVRSKGSDCTRAIKKKEADAGAAKSNLRYQE
jgi:hypothetical protein